MKKDGFSWQIACCLPRDVYDMVLADAKRYGKTKSGMIRAIVMDYYSRILGKAISPLDKRFLKDLEC